mmetsp:Transcript_5512/g.14183  ORF Transcript_5512/g.14183 Transcript_5512/m.14183 type:complete len:99 (+) Transcript_5512:1263-1559(+)
MSPTFHGRRPRATTIVFPSLTMSCLSLLSSPTTLGTVIFFCAHRPLRRRLCLFDLHAPCWVDDAGRLAGFFFSPDTTLSLSLYTDHLQTRRLAEIAVR